MSDVSRPSLVHGLSALAFAAAAFAACSGGLRLDAGNAFPCDFDQDEATRDAACPSGWVCGVTHRCQRFAEEGLAANATPPVVGPGTLIAPRVLDAGVVALARDPLSGAVRAALNGNRNVDVFAGISAESDGGIPFEQGLRLGAQYAYLYDGGTLSVFDGGSTGVVTLTPGDVIRAIRGYPGPPTPPTQLLFTRPGQALQTAHYWLADGGVREMPVGVNLLIDARPVPADLLSLSPAAQTYTSVALYVSPLDPDRRARLYYRTPDPAGSWVAFDDDSPGVFVPVGGSGALRHTINADVWAAALRAPLWTTDVLSVWELDLAGGVPVARRAWKDCAPCPVGRTIRGFEPTFVGAPAVEVICEATDNSGRATVKITGSAARVPTDPCLTEAFTPPFDLTELASGDSVMSAQVALGGASGQVWVGTRLSRLQPLFLDRIPEALGTANLARPDGGVTRFVMPFTRDYFAVGLPGTDFVTARPREAAPRSAIEGAPNWFVIDGARVMRLEPGGAVSAEGLTEKYGPRLLDATGAAASGPYAGGASGDGGTFVLAAADSLYEYTVSALRTFPSSNPLDDLTPQLTPQAGSPIRSLALQQPPAATTDLHGYGVTGSTLFAFSREGDPQRWAAQRIDLSSEEPVKVWMDTVQPTLGRVGYRDGSIFTLPGGLPMVGPLPPDAQGRPNRVFDFAAPSGWPICLAERGLYIAARVDGQRTLVWQRVNVGPELAAALARPQPGRLVDSPTGGVLLFLDRGRVFLLGGTP
ncbi:MAG: hypothetical protein ACKVPX_00770 [Myxococcaceae bacterium]